MFELFNLSTDSGTAISRLKVYDQTKLESHLASIGIGMSDINFFIWEALPGKSYGRFLVYEHQWKEAFPNNPTEDTIGLKISWITPGNPDQDGTLIEKDFTNLTLTGTAFLMSPNEPTPTQPQAPDQDGNEQPPIQLGQDGQRLMIVDVEHNVGYTKGHTLIEEATTFPGISGLFVNGGMLQHPNLFNIYTLPSIPKSDYIAYIASTHFLTTFLLPGGGQPKLTNDLFEYPDPEVNPLLYNKVVTRKTPPQVVFVLQSDDLCKNEFFRSQPMPLDFSNEENYFYKSPVRTNSEVDGIEILIPYAMVDHRKLEFDEFAGRDEANRFRDKITYYAQKRMLREVDMIYQGLVMGELAQDVQRITYYFQGSNGGLRTRIQTIPWEVTNAILAPRTVTCKDVMFRAVLLTDMTISSEGMPKARAVITKILDKMFLIDRDAEINDPLKLFVGLKAGAQVYVYRECKSCKYVIIQGECPPTSVPPTTPMGKCCVNFQIENNDSTNYCYEVTSKTCEVLGGTWTQGGQCPDLPDAPYCT